MMEADEPNELWSIGGSFGSQLVPYLYSMNHDHGCNGQIPPEIFGRVLHRGNESSQIGLKESQQTKPQV